MAAGGGQFLIGHLVGPPQAAMGRDQLVQYLATVDNTREHADLPGVKPIRKLVDIAMKLLKLLAEIRKYTVNDNARMVNATQLVYVELDFYAYIAAAWKLHTDWNDMMALEGAGVALEQN